MHFSTSASPAPGMLDTQQIATSRFWRFARLAMLTGGVLHSSFAVIALVIHAQPLFYLQMASLALYGASYICLGRRIRWLVESTVWIDLLGHSALASLLVGPDAGFMYYPWILIGLLFSNVSRSIPKKLLAGALLLLIYIGSDLLLRQHAPTVTLSAVVTTLLRYSNLTCYLAIVGCVALAHAREGAHAEAHLRSVAGTDMLTGLLNRRRMSDYMRQEVAIAQTGRRPLSVMLLDVDEFKLINDRYGHGRGDQVIVRIGQVLTQTVRESDLVARWGGEEFLILLPGTLKDAAHELSERVRSSIAAQISADERGDHPVTATIGVAVWRLGESLEETIHRADKALYQGKNDGRNRVMIDDSSVSLRFAS